jgi:hypothetical protein
LSQKEFASQYFKNKADIYRVKNSGFVGFSFFRLFETGFVKKPEDRIDEILISLGYLKA